MKPFVGLPTAPEFTGCAYAADIDRPACGQPVTVHVLGHSPGWGLVNLPTCGAHLSTARAAFTEIHDEHAAEGCNGEHYAPEESA